MLIAEYGDRNDWRWRGVGVDPEEGRVTFYRCHWPQRFFALAPLDEYSCALSELRGVCWNRIRGIGRVLDIVTPAGRVFLPRTAKGFDAVHAAILAGLPPTARLRWYQYPSGQLVIMLPIFFAAGLLGTLLLAFAPKWTQVAFLILAVLVGISLIVISVLQPIMYRAGRKERG